MPAHRSPARRRLGVHFVRVASFTAALTAFTTIVVADVIAAEPIEALAPILMVDEDEPIELADREVVGAAALSAAGVKLPEVMPAAVEPLPELIPDPPKKKRKSKLKFGRFEGY